MLDLRERVRVFLMTQDQAVFPDKCDVDWAISKADQQQAWAPIPKWYVAVAAK